MPAITISREIGSKGDTIAEQAANRLGYQLVDKNAIEKVFTQFGYIDFKETYEAAGFWAQFDPRRAEMVSFLNRVVETMVYHGNVILVGRGGFALLKNYADVLNVRIQGPFDLRVERVMKNQFFGSQAKAEEFVRESDKMRREFVESIHAGQWDSASAFDLVIDTGKISTPLAVDWLVAAAHELERAKPSNRMTTRSLRVDPVLLDSVSRVLGIQPA